MKNPSCLSKNRKYSMPFLPGLVTDSLSITGMHKVKPAADLHNTTLKFISFSELVLSKKKKHNVFAYMMGQIVIVMINKHGWKMCQS